MSRDHGIKRKRVEKLLVETSLGYKEIGALVGVTKQRVGQIAKVSRLRYQGQFIVNITRARSKTKRLAKLLAKKKDKIDKEMKFIERIRNLVEDQGYSFNEVAMIFNKPCSTIVRLAHIYGVKSRYRSLNPEYANRRP